MKYYQFLMLLGALDFIASHTAKSVSVALGWAIGGTICTIGGAIAHIMEKRK